MYHSLVIAPNQEENSLLTRVQEAFTLKKSVFTYALSDDPVRVLEILEKERPDYIFLSSNYSPHEQLARLSVVATHIKQTRRLIPLVYVVDWKNPLPTLLGTSWSGQVGILHLHSSTSEIIDLFQRLDGFGVTVGL